MRVKEWLVLQWVQRVGSAMRPRSISTVVENEQTWQRKKASRISGIMLEVRMIMPEMVINWSISARQKMCYKWGGKLKDNKNQSLPIIKL